MNAAVDAASLWPSLSSVSMPARLATSNAGEAEISGNHAAAPFGIVGMAVIFPGWR